MADLRVHHIESRSSQPVGQPWPVTVALNNLETVAFAWESGTCNENGEPGHKASVTLTVRDSNGGEAWSETKETCIPRNRVGQMMGANKRVVFNPEVALPGEFTITATVEAINSVGQDTSDPERVTITGVEETEQVDDGNDNGDDSWIPDSPDNGDNSPFTPDLSTQQKAALAGVGLLIVLAVARPYASLGAEVAG